MLAEELLTVARGSGRPSGLNAKASWLFPKAALTVEASVTMFGLCCTRGECFEWEPGSLVGQWAVCPFLHFLSFERSGALPSPYLELTMGSESQRRKSSYLATW